ncbi:T9SS type A sorting domain-containing protein [Flavilitoribacter nigricans]|uniref:T9SS type A sorting domain-containing protein n=1 Tax=Flavilitoribacter nigricans (strain ATCC 23147 / DSM 23189 / NBRC 102662 / NCIMB 1420 / SS-2) TaxID=1122177 RepID=A0A2D0MYZ2_FLAN2|nr:T9SS type A sorting domain-containing protein [Flavilitoribacter nigricans]PHN01346.1 hypothetical protein CRP01_37410 [Flavilitoribacter nigricans DSM 23189 = NBRC 102662]
MKNILLILICVVIAFNLGRSQTCIPDNNLPDSVIVSPIPYQDTIPGSGIMDTACVNSYFETVLQFQVPSSVTISSINVPIQSVDLATEGAVKGAPAGFDYVCNPPNCVFESDTTGCILLYGTPAAGSEGLYPLSVDIVIRSAIDFPLTLPDGTIVTGSYAVAVKPEGSENCTIPNATNDYLQQYISLSNVPNPFGDYTEIRVTSEISGPFSFEVYNMLGQQVHRRSVRLLEGPNYIPFESNNLSNGMYQYVLRNQQGVISGKMLLSRGQ